MYYLEDMNLFMSWWLIYFLKHLLHFFILEQHLQLLEKVNVTFIIHGRIILNRLIIQSNQVEHCARLYVRVRIVYQTFIFPSAYLIINRAYWWVQTCLLIIYCALNHLLILFYWCQYFIDFLLLLHYTFRCYWAFLQFLFLLILFVYSQTLLLQMLYD